MTKLSHLGLLFLLLGVFASPSANAVGFHLSLAGTGTLPKSTTATVDGFTSTSKLGFGGGVLVGTRFSPYWGLETGALLLQRGFTLSGEFLGSPISTEGAFKSLYIPLGPRIYLGRFFSLQAGGYFDLGLESGGGSNYGVQGGARLSIPLSQGVSIFADARYNQGLKDQDGSKQSDTLLALVGITFGAAGR